MQWWYSTAGLLSAFSPVGPQRLLLVAFTPLIELPTTFYSLRGCAHFIYSVAVLRVVKLSPVFGFLKVRNCTDGGADTPPRGDDNEGYPGRP